MAFWFYSASAAVIGLLLLAAASQIRMRIRYSRSGELDDLILIIQGLYGAYRHRLEIPAILLRGWNIFYEKTAANQIAGQTTGKKKQWRKGTGALIRALKPGSPWRKLLKNVKCTRFRLDSRVGTGDAPSTAIAAGLLWTLHGCAIGFASHVMDLKTRPHGGVEPVYGSQEFSLVWEADLQVRLGSILWSVFKLGKNNLRWGLSWRRRINLSSAGGN